MRYNFKRQDIKKSTGKAAHVLKLLRAFLDAKEPELVYFLVNTWRAQGKAITYKELREAILEGTLDLKYLEEWRQDYSRFVVQHLKPRWDEAMQAAVKNMELKYPEWYFDPMHDGVIDWSKNRAAEFVTSVSNAQFEGLRAVVEQAAVLETTTVDELARAIRPMVGLYRGQTVANLRYYENLITNGVNKKKALDLSIRYGARQHRYRGYLIARTELAFAYNQGAYEGIKQAQEKGYVAGAKKIWCTADDERAHECEICWPLEGKEIDLDENFDFSTKLSTPGIRLTPPAHPNCRCSVLYEPY